MSAGFRLRSLSFTGPGASRATLDFADGLNVVYGASNTGKSFIAKALDFMLGGGRALPEIDERRDYDAALLALILPDGREATLYRATIGGGFLLFDGLHQERPAGVAGLPLRAEHDSRSVDNVSQLMLSALGLSGKVVVKNQFGDKESLSFRRIAPYVIVEEGAIMDERSPILSGQRTSDTVERNVFRLLLTGHDDAAVVSSVRPAIRKARVQGQVDLVDEWIERIDAELGDAPRSRDELNQRAEQLEATLASQHAELRARQERIDALVSERREVADRIADITARLGELELTLERFAELDRVYQSDVARLQALEEGGFLLLAIAGRPCPLCGADPEHQTHHHEADEIARTRGAAAAEIAKIERERRDLAQTTVSLGADVTGLQRRRDTQQVRLAQIETELDGLRPHEAELQSGYERLLTAREGLRRTLGLYEERDRLVVRRSQLSAREPRQGEGDTKPTVGLDSGTGHRFAQIVQRLLRTWHYPGDPVVTFDPVAHDIQINGKARSANGKGVRAVLHAAFKVGVLLYCRENGLPHPGFVVLDTPLLTYREPLRQPRHGALAPDEEALKATSLSEHFYASLAGMRDLAQFVVLENADPPISLQHVRITTFTGGAGAGRFGFFPVKPPHTADR
jgi:hypothetical protein